MAAIKKESMSLEITLRELPNSAAVDAKIRQKVDKLTQFCDRIQFCKVVVELYQKHKHQGRLFTVHLEVAVPVNVLVVNHKVGEDIYMVLRDTFTAMKRKLDEYVGRQRGFVKAHSELLRGRVSRLFEDYGFIEGIDGREFYFHSNNVHPKFESLTIGIGVSFLETYAGDSLQAAQVSVME